MFGAVKRREFFYGSRSICFSVGRTSCITFYEKPTDCFEAVLRLFCAEIGG